MEKNGSFRNTPRSRLGLIFLGLVYLLPLHSGLVIDQPFFVQPSPFKYSEVSSISFHLSSDLDWDLKLGALLKDMTQGKVVVVDDSSKGINANALLSNLSTYVVIRKGKEKTCLVTISSWVSATAEQKYSGKMPLFSQILVFDQAKNARDIEQEITSALKTFIDKVLKESAPSKKMTFFVM